VCVLRRTKNTLSAIIMHCNGDWEGGACSRPSKTAKPQNCKKLHSCKPRCSKKRWPMGGRLGSPPLATHRQMELEGVWRQKLRGCGCGHTDIPTMLFHSPYAQTLEARLHSWARLKHSLRWEDLLHIIQQYNIFHKSISLLPPPPPVPMSRDSKNPLPGNFN